MIKRLNWNKKLLDFWHQEKKTFSGCGQRLSAINCVGQLEVCKLYIRNVLAIADLDWGRKMVQIIFQTSLQPHLVVTSTISTYQISFGCLLTSVMLNLPELVCSFSNPLLRESDSTSLLQVVQKNAKVSDSDFYYFLCFYR